MTRHYSLAIYLKKRMTAAVIHRAKNREEAERVSQTLKSLTEIRQIDLHEYTADGHHVSTTSILKSTT